MNSSNNNSSVGGNNVNLEEIGQIVGRNILLSPEELLTALPYITCSKAKSYKGAQKKVAYFNFRGCNPVVTLGSYESPVSIPFGVSEPYVPPGAQPPPVDPSTIKRMSMKVNFDEEQPECKVFSILDDRIIELAKSVYDSWDERKIKPEEIRYNYNEVFKTENSKGESVPPGINLKVNDVHTNYTIYTGKTDNGKHRHIHARMSEVVNGSFGRIAVALRGIYFVARKWGLDLQVISVDVFKTTSNTSKLSFRNEEEMVIDDDDSGDEFIDSETLVSEDQQPHQKKHQQQQQHHTDEYMNALLPAGEHAAESAAAGGNGSPELPSSGTKRKRGSSSNDDGISSSSNFLIMPGQSI